MCRDGDGGDGLVRVLVLRPIETGILHRRAVEFVEERLGQDLCLELVHRLVLLVVLCQPLPQDVGRVILPVARSSVSLSLFLLVWREPT